MPAALVEMGVHLESRAGGPARLPRVSERRRRGAAAGASSVSATWSSGASPKKTIRSPRTRPWTARRHSGSRCRERPDPGWRGSCSRARRARRGLGALRRASPVVPGREPGGLDRRRGTTGPRRARRRSSTLYYVSGDGMRLVGVPAPVGGPGQPHRAGPRHSRAAARGPAGTAALAHPARHRPAGDLYHRRRRRVRRSHRGDRPRPIPAGRGRSSSRCTPS